LLTVVVNLIDSPRSPTPLALVSWSVATVTTPSDGSGTAVVVTAVLVLLPVFASTSPPPAATVAELTRGNVNGDGVVPVMVTLELAPAASGPPVQVTVLPTVEQPTAALETPVTPAGTVSVSVYELASPGPPLVTVTIQAIGEPAAAASGANCVTPRSTEAATAASARATRGGAVGSVFVSAVAAGASAADAPADVELGASDVGSTVEVGDCPGVEGLAEVVVV
jgi:hypothetical protein